jgi:hypothetical protein
MSRQGNRAGGGISGMVAAPAPTVRQAGGISGLATQPTGSAEQMMAQAVARRRASAVGAGNNSDYGAGYGGGMFGGGGTWG